MQVSKGNLTWQLDRFQHFNKSMNEQSKWNDTFLVDMQARCPEATLPKYLFSLESKKRSASKAREGAG